MECSELDQSLEKLPVEHALEVEWSIEDNVF